MSRRPMDRGALAYDVVTELPHPTSTGRRLRVYRHLLGLTLGDGRELLACALCTAVYGSREALRRHIRRVHRDVLRAVDAHVAAGSARFLVDDSLGRPSVMEPAPDLGAPDLGDVLQRYASELSDRAGALAAERDQWRKRALSAEKRLAVVTGALSAPTTALPIITPADRPG